MKQTAALLSATVRAEELNGDDITREMMPILAYDAVHKTTVQDRLGFGQAGKTLGGHAIHIGLEMEYNESRNYSQEECKRHFFSFKDDLILALDASVSAFEVITRPLSPSAQKSLWRKILTKSDHCGNTFSESLGLENSSSTGCHVNVSRSSFENESAVAFAVAICNNIEQFSTVLAGRSETRYACKSYKKPGEPVFLDPGKHVALRVGLDRLEWRSPIGTSNIKNVCLYVDFACFLVDISNHCASQNIWPNWEVCEEFLNKSNYHDLKEFIDCIGA